MANPAMGDFNDLLGLTPVELQPVMTGLRTLVLAVKPAAVETVRLGDRAATYGLGPRKMIEGCVYLMPHARWINLGFYRGTSLTDPGGLLQGTGKALRHVKIQSSDALTDPGLADLIRAAFTERQQALR